MSAKTKRGSGWIVGCAFLIILLTALVGGTVFLTTKIPEVSTQSTGTVPLIVTLVTPLNGASVSLNESIDIATEILGPNAVRAVELWIDGELAQVETLPAKSNIKQYRAVWSWKPIAEGEHTLIVRARDAEQRSGNSNVVRVTAQKNLPATAIYTTQPGDTLATVAQQFKSTPQQIVDLNATVDPNASLPAGELLTIQLPPQPIIPPQPAPDEVLAGPEQALAPSSSLPTSIPLPLPPQPPTVPTGPTQVPSNPPNKNLFWLTKNLTSLISIPPLPVAPELAAKVDQCNVHLFLSDKSNNEDGFFIYRLDSKLSAPQLVATIGGTNNPLPIHYTDSALYGFVQYQVASFNAAGESLSNFVGAKITDPTCFNSQWKKVTLAKMNLVVPQPFDKVYLYFSINNGPWQRIPSSQNQFMYPNKGQFDVSKYLDQIQIDPTQGEFSIDLEVWGWKGKTLINAGRVKRAFDSSRLEGVTEITGDGFALRGELVNVASKYQSTGGPFLPSIAPPTRLASTSDPKVCANHAPLGKNLALTNLICVVGIENNYIVLVWNWKPWEVCPYAKCIAVSDIDGYHIYRITETFYTYKTDLVKTITGADVHFTLFPWNDSGDEQCYIVRAFKGTFESEASNQVCAQLPPMGAVANTDTPFSTNTARFDVETAAVVIPPQSNQSCWNNGRLLIGAASADGTALLSRDLLGSANINDIRTLLPLPSPDNNVPSFNPFAFITYTVQSLPQHWLTSDHQIARLPNGDLLFIRHGHTVAPLSPKPSWWDNIVGPPTGKFSPRPGERTATAVWRSSDCGNTWKLVSKIDAAVVSVEGKAGRCGWPRKKNGIYQASGFDRSELYVDPWNGTIYIASACMGDHTNDADLLRDKVVLFVSKTGGYTWEDARALDYKNNPEVWTPIAMTSFPSGRVSIFGCTSGGEPRLFWSDDQGKTINGPHKVFYGSETNAENKCGLVDGVKIPGGQRNGGYPIAGISSLSRVSSTAEEDIIRVSYASIVGNTNSRQVQRILSVHIKSDGTVTAIPVKTIIAEHPLGHVLQATFIESDRVELPKNSASNVAVMYWIESTDKQLFARYSVARGEFIWSVPADLSVTGGQRRSWLPNNNGWAGDYMHGAFFFDGTNLNFLAQWPESEPQYKDPNMIVHYNIIQVPFSQSDPIRQIK